MKKLFVLCLLSFVFCMGVEVLAYSQNDIDTANFLAEKGIVTKQSNPKNYRLDDYITRAELVGISLKLKGTPLPEDYKCKKYFSDVTANDWICRAIELAADGGLVSRENRTFNSQRNITRAESLAIILKASGLLDKMPEVLTNYIDRDFVFVPRAANLGQYANIEEYLDFLMTTDLRAKDKRVILVDPFDWQFTIIQKGLYLKIIRRDDFSRGHPQDFLDGKKNPISDYDTYDIWSFSEWYFITRADAFKFMKNTYDKRELVSGEVSI